MRARDMSIFKRTAVALVATSALLVGACGSATVEEDESASSVEPLPRNTDSGDDKDKGKDASDSHRGGDSNASRDNGSTDIGAREVDELPDEEQALTPEQTEYIEHLTEKKIDVKGLEGALIGAGDAVCTGEDTANITANAIAGQLVELNRTELTPEDAAALIVDEAKATYC